MNHQRLLIPLASLTILAACVFVYWPGLYGAFVFDDIPNLGPIRDWLFGNTGWRTAVFDNLAGPMGRPISMVSFMIDATIWGMDPFGFKLGNLVLHLAIGITIFFLVEKIVARNLDSEANPALIAAAITTIWLLHPMHAGTVLYVVQRMAMLSTMFIALAMLAYVIGRTHIEAGRFRRGAIWIFLGVPALTMLGAFSKENGLLAPLLCGVIEWAWFRPAAETRRPPAVRTFLIWIVAAPVIASLALVLFWPEAFMEGYGNRRYSLIERLLTQSRVLFDYLGKLLWPGKFSMYRDDYTISTSLFSPPSTALALLGWFVAVTAAIGLRHRIPLFGGGVGIFLGGHAMESSVFPLMIYFEHRNYFPSIGIFLALAGLFLGAWQKLKPKMDNPRVVSAVGLAGLFIVLAFATHGRALVWETKELLILQSLEHYPSSRFARVEMATMEMNRSLSNPNTARYYLNPLLQDERPLVRLSGQLMALKIDCVSDGELSRRDLDRVFKIVPDTLEADVVSSQRELIDMSKDSVCLGLDPELLADYLSIWLDQVPQPEKLQLKARIRLEIAEIYLEKGRYEDAITQAQMAQTSGLSPAQTGLLMTSLYVKRGKFSQAADMLDKIEHSLDPGDEGSVRRLQQLRDSVSNAYGSHLSQDN